MVRQADKLLALLGNEAEIRKQLNAEKASGGLADERYLIYLESVEAAQNKMTASWEKMISSSASEKLITGLYETGAAILDIVTAVGGLAPILITAGLAYAAFASEISLSSVIATLSVVTLQGGVAALGAEILALMATNPVGWAILAVGAIVMIANAIPTAQERLDKLNESIAEHEKTISSLKDKSNQITSLGVEYQKLKKEVDKTGVSSQAFLDVQNKLHELVPSLTGKFDAYGNYILNTSQNMDTLNTSTQKQIELEEKLMQIELDKSAKKSAKSLKTLYNVAQNEGITAGGTTIYLPEEQQLKNELAYIKALESEKSRFRKMGDDAQQEYIAELTGSDIQKVFLDIIDEIMDKAKDIVEQSPPIKIPVTLSLKEQKDKLFEDLIANQDFSKLTSEIVDMLKRIANAKKDALQKELKDLKDKDDKIKESYKLQIEKIKEVNDEKKRALEAEAKAQNELYDSQKKAIEEQLKAYERIIDFQKESIRLKKEEEDFNNARAEKEKALVDILNQISVLSLDTSEEAIAQRLTLEAEASQMIQELAQSDADRAYELQMQALDAEQQAAQESADIQLSEIEQSQAQYERESELRQQSLEEEVISSEKRYEIITKGLDDSYAAKEKSLNEQISLVDDYLEKEGNLRREAMDIVLAQNDSTLKQLTEWNREYGTGIDNDITKMWEAATLAVEDYTKALFAASQIPFPSGDPSQNSEYVDVYNGRNNPNVLYAGRHSGVKSGFVGNQPKLKSNEEFAKLLDGELVVNSKQMDTFMKNLSPATMNSNPSSSSSNFAGGVSMGNLMNIVVNGSLDKTILPSIKNIADQVLDELNKALLIRGSNRTANLFGN
jgi:hypothetical protein